MSRIGKKAVPVPAGVTASVNGQMVSVKGPKGELKVVLNDQVLAKMEQGGIKVDPKDKSKLARSSWGMSRTLVANLITGVTVGYYQVTRDLRCWLSCGPQRQGVAAEPRLQP